MNVAASKRVENTRYGNRNWVVWLDGELLAVTVYKKGHGGCLGVHAPHHAFRQA